MLSRVRVLRRNLVDGEAGVSSLWPEAWPSLVGIETLRSDAGRDAPMAKPRSLTRQVCAAFEGAPALREACEA